MVCRICDFGPLFNALYMISHIVDFIILVRTVFKYLGLYSVQDDCYIVWLFCVVMYLETEMRVFWY